MKNRFFIVSALVLVLLSLSLPVMAEETGSLVTPAMLEEAAKEANISHDQMSAIMGTWFASQRELIKLKADLELKGLDLVNAMESEKTDSKAIIDLVRQMGDIRTQIDLAHMKFSLKVMETLRPEQTGKLRQIIKKRTMSDPSGKH